MVNRAETIQTLRRYGIETLEKAGIESPAADAGLILMFVLQIDKTQLLISNALVSEEKVRKYHRLLSRRAQGEPTQYIVGKCEFMSLEFEVNRDTLIPRPDTEILVEWVLQRENKDLARPLSILDIGTGSGCVAISLAYYLPCAQVVALDISDGALQTAKHNAEQLKVESHIKFLSWDILDGFPIACGHFDYIVSNPPYIPPEDIGQLQREVREFEPYHALYGGPDGLRFYRSISKNAAKFLNHGGALVLEVGIGQAEAVTEIIDATGSFFPCEIIKDLSKIERVVSAIRLP